MFSKDMFSRHKLSISKSKVLPHLTTKGVSIPDVQVSATDNELLMPGEKPLPDDWKNENEQQLVPSNQSNILTKRLSVQKHGSPGSGRGNDDDHAEPPPMFSANPSRTTSIRHVRESNAQKQVYRMDGGVDPVSLLTSRLEAWRLAIKALVSLFKKIIAIEERTSKGLIEASKDISAPFEKSNGQFLEVGTGGIQDVWGAVRDYTVEHGIMFHESSGYVEKSVVPSLRAIKTDIKNMLIAIQKDRHLKSDTIFESRLKVDKLIGRLDKSIEQCNRNYQQADQNTDPFLINLHIIHAIRELCDNENRLHDSILNLQKEVGLFEEKIIENVRHVFQKFQEYRLIKKMEHKDIIDKVTQTFNSIKPSLEWNEFVRRHQYNLILENSAYKTEDMVEYPHQHSTLTRAIKVGSLDSKAGPLKGYSQSVFILTPAGFLHGYKSANYFQQSPLQPTCTIFIPNCDVEYEEADASFQIRSTNKRVSIGLGTTHSFRPASQEEGDEWKTELRKLADQFRVVPILDNTTSFFNVPSQSDKPALPANVMPIPQAVEQSQAAADSDQIKGESDMDPVLDGEQPELQQNNTFDPLEDHPHTLSPHPTAAIIATSDKIAADETTDHSTTNSSQAQSIFSTSVVTNADSADVKAMFPTSNSSNTIVTESPVSPNPVAHDSTQHNHNASVDTITQPICINRLNQSAPIKVTEESPRGGIHYTGSTTSIDAINNYVGLGDMTNLSTPNVNTESPSQQLKNQGSLNQTMYDQTAPISLEKTTTNPLEEGYDDDNSSVGYYSVTNEEFDKTVGDGSDDMEQLQDGSASIAL